MFLFTLWARNAIPRYRCGEISERSGIYSNELLLLQIIKLCTLIESLYINPISLYMIKNKNTKPLNPLQQLQRFIYRLHIIKSQQ